MDLATDRLVLRRWRDEDFTPFSALNADPAVMEFLGAPLERAASDAMVERFEQEFEERGFGLYAVEEKETGQFIGFIGLHEPAFTAHFTPCVEIGWRLRHASWGQGLATEGARAVREHAHGELRLDEIVSMTTLANLRSQSVMKKIGLTRDPADDFMHPSPTLREDLRPHVLYRGRASDAPMA